MSKIALKNLNFKANCFEITFYQTTILCTSQTIESQTTNMTHHSTNLAYTPILIAGHAVSTKPVEAFRNAISSKEEDEGRLEADWV